MPSFVYWLQTNPHRGRPYSPRTVQSYSDQAGLFDRWLKDNQLTYPEVTRDDILNHFADLVHEGKSAGTISLRLATIRKLYQYLIERHVCTENPAVTIPFRTSVTHPGEPYTENEIRRMYAACRNWQERAVFLLMLGVGLRRSEVARISRDDCNFDSGTIRILRKGGQYQFVMPEPSVMQALESALEFNDRLCWQKSSDYVDNLVKRLGKRANIPGRHHAHRLRYTFAVQWCEAGGQESELMMALGHSSPRMTQHYSKVGRERRAMRSMHTMGIAAKLLGMGTPVEQTA